MADPQYLIDSAALKKAIDDAGANPSQIVQSAMDLLESASEGAIQYVDASNPAISNLETSAVIHASGLDQSVALLGRIYPALAQTPEQLYAHMSYRDYINRFASPSTDPFMLFFPESQFMQRAIRVPNSDYHKVTIPRDTTIRVNDYVTFTLQYPVDIKYYDAQHLEVAYNTDRTSPIQDLTTNMLVPELFVEPGTTNRWIGVQIEMPQVNVSKQTGNIQAGRYFVHNYNFTDQYFMARVWYRNSDTAPWTEMVTTYSPTVYDPTVPTAQLKVIDATLNVSIPLIYQNSGLISGDVRVDIYTTKGAEVLDLANYEPDQFLINMEPLDPVLDTDQYTAAAIGINFTAKSNSVMSGGKNALTFAQLKDRVINNSVGPQEKPITNVNIKSEAEDHGFELVPNTDVVTNRIFLATRALPAPSDSRLITPATIGISTYITDDPKGVSHPWVKNHGERTTFLSKNLWQSENGIMRLMGANEVESLKVADPIVKLRMVNNNKYLYTPFYYVLDTDSEELQVRAYNLDTPEASNLNFISQNPTIQLVINTASNYSMQKVDDGYILQIQTKSGTFYKNLLDNEVYAQLAVRLKNSTRYAYWLGKQVAKTADGERIFQFNLDTTYDLDGDDQLYLTNGQIDNTSVAPIEVDLTSTFEIFHITTSLTGLYRPSNIDELIGRFQISDPCAGVTRESLKLKFGANMVGLWTRGRTLPDSESYQRYAEDIPLVYDHDVFADPPFTIDGEQIIYDYIARAGEIVYEGETPVILHKKGDVVYYDGKPVVSEIYSGQREFDLLTVDGQYYFVDDDAYLDYRKEFTRIIVDWITNDIPVLQRDAIEKTKIYFYPKNQLDNITLLIDDYTEQTIPSAQSFELSLYVSDMIYRSTEQRERIKNLTIRYLASWVSGLEVSVSDAIDALKDLYGDDVKSLTMPGLGGALNLQYALISKQQSRMSLKRNLQALQSGKYIIQEDVVVNFYKANPIPIDFT